MSKTMQAEVKRVALATSVTDSDVQAMVDAFNEVAGSDLNSDEAFTEQLTETQQGFLMKLFSKAKEKPLAKMKSYLNEHQDDSAANRQLNRALIHGLFQNELPPLKRALGEITTWVRLSNEPQSLAPTDGFMTVSYTHLTLPTIYSV